MNENWQLFIEFCRQEISTGGPDPQVEIMAHLSKDKSREEKIWLAGCYGAHHCVPSAVVVWQEFRPQEVYEDSSRLSDFLAKNWPYLPVRPEMKSHRMHEKRLECLEDFARLSLTFRQDMPYDEAWVWSIRRVKYFNRYMAIKFLEILYRSDFIVPALEDMRAKGAWSPRTALGLLWPRYERTLADREDNSNIAIEITENCAKDTKSILLDNGVYVSFFQLQVLLCEFREALVGGYYPGASLDEEIDYIAKTDGKFNLDSVYRARLELFPPEYLGEIGGWKGLRKEKFKAFKGAVEL